MAIKRKISTLIPHLCKPCRAHIPNATYQVPRPLVFWFQRRRFLKGFTLYGHGDHFGHVTIYICFKSLLSTYEINKGAKIRNRYNQKPHLTQDINVKVTNSQ